MRSKTPLACLVLLIILATLALAGCGGGSGGGLTTPSGGASIPTRVTDTYVPASIQVLNPGSAYGRQVVSVDFIGLTKLVVKYAGSSYVYKGKTTRGGPGPGDIDNMRPSSTVTYELIGGTWLETGTAPIIPALMEEETALYTLKPVVQNGYRLGCISQSDRTGMPAATIGSPGELLEITQISVDVNKSFTPVFAIAATPGAEQVCVLGRMYPSGKGLIARGGPDPELNWPAYLAIVKR